MLTHSEAQALISASLDQPLDPDIEDVLAEHLATCAECRYFAASSQRLASALASFPTIPASQSVREGVWEAIESPTPWWQRVGGAFSGQTAAVVSTAAIALLVIALATLTFMRLNDDGNGDDEAARLAAGTNESIALATETVAPTETSVVPTDTPESTATRPSTDTPAPTETQPPTETPAPTETLAPTSAPTETLPPTSAPTEPADTPVDLTGETAPPTEETAEPPVDLTGTEAAPTPNSGVQVASAPENEASPTVAPEPTATPEATATSEPTATPSPTPEPTATPSPTPEPQPADFTVTLLDQNGEPVPNACWVLIQDGETVVESCDTPEVESPEFASNGNAGFFDILSGTYTLRMTSGPEGATVDDRTVEIAPGSNDIETITTTVATPTPEPTNTPQPTSTPEPTSAPQPTSTPEPTSTPAPTNTPESPENIASVGTPADTATEEETSPPIEPIEDQPAQGGDTDAGTETPASVTEATAPAGTGSGPSQDVITPAEATRTAGGEPVATEPQVIVPVDGATVPAQTAEAATGDGTGATVPADSDGYDLGDAPIPYEAWDDTSLRLTFQDGGIVFTAAPDRVSLDGPAVQQESDDDATFLVICDGDCVPATQDSGEGTFTDSSIGWVNGQLIYQRQTGSGEVELRSLTWVGEPAGDVQIGTASTTLTPFGAAYAGDSGLLIPCVEGWLLVGDGQATVIDDNPYGDPSLVRTNFSAPLIAYVAGGQLIIAEQSAPGTPVSTIPFNGVDFDLSPGADRVAISTGQGLEIWSRDGQLLGASGSQVRTGSLVWLGDGIYTIDLDSGAIRLVDPDVLT